MKPGLIVVVVAVVLAVVLVYVIPTARRLPVGGDIIVRCRRGHLFTTLWVPLASVKAVRLGPARLQRCPVGNHLSLVTPVDPSALSPADVASARAHHDVPVP